MSIYLGLDIGTTSVSVVAWDAATDELRATVTRPHRASVSGGPPDAGEQSVEILQEVVRDCLRDIRSEFSPAPAGLGLTGQMHGFVLVDAALQPVSPLFSWQDRRSLRNDPATGNSYLHDFRARLPDTLRPSLGCEPRPGYATATFAFLKQNGLLPDSADRMLDIASFFGAQLSGTAVIDPTFAASWGIYDLQNDDLRDDVLRAAGIDRSWIPPLVPAGSPAGTVRAEVANHWFLPAGLPVTAGFGDNQASFLGAVQDPARELLINIGTGGQLVWSHPTARPTAEIEVRPYLQQARLHVAAGVAGGDAYMWLVRQVQAWLHEFGRPTTDEQVHRVLAESRDRLNETERGNAPRCRPFFRGTRAEPTATGSFENVRHENFTLGHLAHAVLTGIVDSLCDLYDRAENRLPDLEQVVVAGNFFTHHPWTADRISRRWNVPVVAPKHPEQAACGAARLAARQCPSLHGQFYH